jgi:3-isopropylmalate/(R)-2-methylmalate dehydratase small subunit
MEPFILHKGKAVCLNRVNIDTDQIIPKQFLKRIERTGFGKYLFFDWRYAADGSLSETFELNSSAASGASILVAEDNFGCGSSREHAVWALKDYGFRVIIAPSFADIFYNNCFKNGVLPVALKKEAFHQLDKFRERGVFEMSVDLNRQTIDIGGDMKLTFELDGHYKQRLIEGLDDIGLTLRYNRSIDTYEDLKRKPYQGVYKEA